MCFWAWRLRISAQTPPPSAFGPYRFLWVSRNTCFCYTAVSVAMLVSRVPGAQTCWVRFPSRCGPRTVDIARFCDGLSCGVEGLQRTGASAQQVFGSPSCNSSGSEPWWAEASLRVTVQGPRSFQAVCLMSWRPRGRVHPSAEGRASGEETRWSPHSFPLGELVQGAILMVWTADMCPLRSCCSKGQDWASVMAVPSTVFMSHKHFMTYIRIRAEPIPSLPFPALNLLRGVKTCY